MRAKGDVISALRQHIRHLWHAGHRGHTWARTCGGIQSREWQGSEKYRDEGTAKGRREMSTTAVVPAAATSLACHVRSVLHQHPL